jgi:hypothetical protein
VDLKSDPAILHWLTVKELDSLLELSAYVGIAARRSNELAREIHSVVG